MKKIRFLSLLLCLVLALQCAVVPTYATEAGDTTGETGETAATTATTSPVYDIPTGLIGDASVISGCNTIDAMQPLSTDSSVARSAKGVVLYEMTTGTLVYGKNPDGKL